MIHYITFGDPNNPPLLLLHGLGMGHQMWSPQFSDLSNHFYILAPDLPGFAGSASYGPFSIEKSASLLLTFLSEQSRHPGPVHICGLSLGAMVALQMAIENREAVASLILSGAQVKPPRGIMLLQLFLFSLMPESWLLSQIPKSIPPDDNDIQIAAKNDAIRTGKSGFVQALKNAREANFHGPLSTIQVPTLVLCGEKDKPNLKAARELAQGIPHAKLNIVPDVGHVWNMENPNLFNQYVTQFINEIESSA